ncbi:MAG: rod shape-determining protein MreD [Rhizomicrobium sp.]|jgi:rod shape-determining protein MreD
MQDRFGISFGSGFAAVIPFMTGILGALVANIPVSLFGGTMPPPLLSLMPVYFWCLVRPDLMPPSAAFAIGLVEDLLSGGPPGVWALSFLVCYAVVDRQRDAFAGLAGFGAILGFAAVMLIASGVDYGAVSLLNSRVLPVESLMLQVAISVIFYIPALWLMNGAQRRIIGALRSDF